MDKKSKHFDMRLTPLEGVALGALSKRKGVSKSDYLRQYIRRNARKAKIPV